MQYAAVLDGRRLWLSLDPEPGSPGFREATTGEVLVPTPELTEDEPSWRSARLDLDGLPWTDDTAYDVVLVPPSGRRPRPVWTPPLPPSRTPRTDDGEHRYVVVRSDDGSLRVTRRRLEPALELRRAAVTPEGIQVTITLPPGPTPDPTVVLVDEAGAELVSFESTVRGEVLTAVVGADRLPPRGVLAWVRAGSAADPLPVRRRDDDLLDPVRAVPLPELAVDDDAVLVLRWGGQGLLTARVRGEQETP